MVLQIYSGSRDQARSLEQEFLQVLFADLGTGFRLVVSQLFQQPIPERTLDFVTERLHPGGPLVRRGTWHGECEHERSSREVG